MSEELNQQAVDAAPASTEPVQVVQDPVTITVATAEDPNVGASAAAASSPVESASAIPASIDAGSSQAVVSSPAEPLTFEQMVEQRFLVLEGYLVRLPHSIAYAFHQGSASAEEMAQRAIKHLFGGE